ncbi:hypothetical protein PAPHI01_2125 [Pancytospora philotis]|nr:hypothetical protein PAPHI01_2125 [Pancytospora philotis]
MLLLLSTCARICAGSTPEAQQQNPRSTESGCSAIYSTENPERLFSDISGTRSSAGGYFAEPLWCHEFFSAMHGMYTAASNHIDKIKDSVKDNVLVPLGRFMSHHKDSKWGFAAWNMYRRLKHSSDHPGPPIRHYDKAVSEVLCPAGSPDLAEAYRNFHGTFSEYLINPRVKHLFAQLMISKSDELRTTSKNSNNATAAEEASGICNSFLMANVCSGAIEYARSLADSSDDDCAALYISFHRATAIFDDMAAIGEHRSNLKAMGETFFININKVLEDLDHKILVIRQLNELLQELESEYLLVEAQLVSG